MGELLVVRQPPVWRGQKCGWSIAWQGAAGSSKAVAAPHRILQGASGTGLRRRGLNGRHIEVPAGDGHKRRRRIRESFVVGVCAWGRSSHCAGTAVAEWPHNTSQSAGGAAISRLRNGLLQKLIMYSE